MHSAAATGFPSCPHLWTWNRLTIEVAPVRGAPKDSASRITHCVVSSLTPH